MVSKLLVALATGASAMRDVPLGECYSCEVTCFEDCSLKYNTEIMGDDFLQLSNQTAKAPAQENRTMALTEQYSKCLAEESCPCRAPAGGADKKMALMASDKKKGKCAVGAQGCSEKCANKVVDKDEAELTTVETVAAAQTQRSLLQKRKFPVKTVKLGAFSKGKMTLDHCLKFCLAATCGCDDAPVNIAKEVKRNAAVKGVTDTAPSKKYRPATMNECGKGMVGKKVAKGLYIKLGGGPGGMEEVCSKSMIGKVAGPSSDPAAIAKKCKSGASDDAKYGCLWDNQKGVCHVGFSPILRCLKSYTTDPTR